MRQALFIFCATGKWIKDLAAQIDCGNFIYFSAQPPRDLLIVFAALRHFVVVG